MKDDHLINASEAGLYCFCKRAREYQKQGHPSQNQSAMTDGREYHAALGKKVTRFGRLRRILTVLIVLLIAAVVFLLLKGVE